MSQPKGRKKNSFFKVFGIVCGLGFGFLLSYSFFEVLCTSFKASVPVSVCVTLIVVIFFALLISLHKPTRCIFFLMIPQFFSKRGRKLLLAYIYFLALSGPADNMVENIHRLSEGIACSEVRKRDFKGNDKKIILKLKHQLILAFQNLVHAIKQPYEMVKETVQQIVPLIKNVMAKISARVHEIQESIEKIGKCEKFN